MKRISTKQYVFACLGVQVERKSFFAAFLIVVVAFILVARNGFAEAKDAKAVAEGSRIVAREDFDVSDKFTPPEILQRRFWNMLPAEAAKAKGQGAITSEPMVVEAAEQYFVPDLQASGNDPLAVSVDKLRPLTPDHKKPFVVYCTVGRPPFRCLDDFRADKAGYEKWKQEHPNFLGFWTGVEWDNEFISYALSNDAGTIAQGERERWTKAAIERTKAVKTQCLANRDAAVRGLHECYTGLRRYFFDDPDAMMFLRAAWCFDHYSLEWGAGMAILETTNTGPYRHQAAMYHIRGTSRQYGKPWEWYMATYYNGHDKNGKVSVNNEPNYVSTTHSEVLGQEESSGPGFGMSVSLKRRDMYLAYLAGASVVQHEDWPRAYCRLEKGSPDKWTLSPHGEAMKEWYAFTKQHPDRGISYAPIALLTPFSQGMPVWGGSPWSHFSDERADRMIDAFFYTIAPFTQDTKKGKEGCLANSRFGDGYDVLVPNPPSGPVALEKLLNYKVAVLLGKYDLTSALAQRLMEYVRQGGTLVINSRQIGDRFPDEFLGVRRSGKTLAVESPLSSTSGGNPVALAMPYDYEPIELRGAQSLWTDSKGGILASIHHVGRGNVLLTTVDFMLPRECGSIAATTTKMPLVGLLMRQIVDDALPVKVEGDIQYGLNKVADGWWLYLINNKGVTKFTNTPEELNAAETAEVTVDMRALQVESLAELRVNATITRLQDKNAFAIQVGPGDIRIVKITTKNNSSSK